MTTKACLPTEARWLMWHQQCPFPLCFEQFKIAKKIICEEKRGAPNTNGCSVCQPSLVCKMACTQHAPFKQFQGLESIKMTRCTYVYVCVCVCVAAAYSPNPHPAHQWAPTLLADKAPHMPTPDGLAVPYHALVACSAARRPWVDIPHCR